jgi:hypothetical protein
MKTQIIQPQLIRQTHFDSASSGGLSAVVHSFQEPGDYVVSFLCKEQVTDRFYLEVKRKGEKRTRLSPMAVTIDLEKARKRVSKRAAQREERCQPEEADPAYVLEAEGYVTFTTPPGKEALAIIAERVDEKGRVKLFDRRRLGADDLFAVTLFRAGTYSVKNTLTGAEGKIVVAYPVIGKEPYRPPKPVWVECGKGGFEPDVIELKPEQSVVFRLRVSSRIKIDLVQLAKGPKKAGYARTASWKKPTVS